MNTEKIWQNRVLFNTSILPISREQVFISNRKIEKELLVYNLYLIARGMVNTDNVIYGINVSLD